MTPVAPQDNPSRDQYSSVAIETCHQALGTLIKDVGGQDHPLLVVIGGLVPSLLIGAHELDHLQGDDPHIGTSDLDLCVQIDLPAEDSDLYKRLETALASEGYIRRERLDGGGESVWGWQRRIDGKSIVLDFLAPEDGVRSTSGRPAPGRIAVNAPTRDGDGIGALRLRGAGLALRDAISKTITIDLAGPDGEAGGGRANVTVWCANILPFVALKSFAIRGRTKDKDAFDLVWLLAHWPPEGPESAARQASESPVVDDPEVTAALALLTEQFGDHEAEGCWRYARFQLGKDKNLEGNDEWIRLARDAETVVTRFLEELSRLRLAR